MIVRVAATSIDDVDEQQSPRAATIVHRAKHASTADIKVCIVTRQHNSSRTHTKSKTNTHKTDKQTRPPCHEAVPFPFA